MKEYEHSEVKITFFEEDAVRTSQKPEGTSMPVTKDPFDDQWWTEGGNV